MANGNLIVHNIVVGNADRGIRSYAVRELRNARTKLLWRNGTSGNQDDTNLGIENTIEALPGFMRDGVRLRRASKAVDPERKQGSITDLGGHKRSRDGGPRSGRLRVVVRDHSR